MIRIDKQRENYEIVARVNNGYLATLGEYATEERAKEVLQEIASTFAIKSVQDTTYQYADIWIKMRQYAIYEMPKE